MKKLIYLLMICFWCMSARGQTENAGRVISALSKQGVAGVSITVKGGVIKTLSGADGQFILPKMNGLQGFIFSSVGYTTKEIEVQFPLKKALLIELSESSLALQEVQVSNGYQNLPKERATGSFSKIDKRLFNQQQSTDVISRLEAIGNSISVDKRTSNAGISIRGLSTIEGIGGPLIVLDNFPYEGNLNNINPNDVESISFLKDAAASSIWGAKAGNGVIVISTKKGKLNQGLSVGFNGAVTLGEKPNLFYKSQMSTSEYIDVEQKLFGLGYYDDQINAPEQQALSPVVELLKDNRNGILSVGDLNLALTQLRGIDVRDEFKQIIYKPLVNQQYALNLQAASEEYSWLFSAGYDHNRDNLNALYERCNLRHQQSWNLSKRLQINSDFYYTSGKSKSGLVGFGAVPSLNISGLYPYARLADDSGNALAVNRGYSQDFLKKINGKGLLDWSYYPLTENELNRSDGETQDFNANMGLRYTIVKGLVADAKYHLERQEIRNVDLHDAQSFFARNLVNGFTQLPVGGDAVYKVPMGGVYTGNNSLLVNRDFRAQLSYNADWKAHQLSIIAGAERRAVKTEAQQFRKYGYDAGTLRTGNVDYNTAFPNYVTGVDDYIPNVDGLSQLNNRFVSLYANASYTYKTRYVISGSARRDASNLYGVNVNEQWTPLWSVGGAWIASSESFYHLDALPYLKLRISYGYGGNTDQGKSAVTIINYLSNNLFTGTPMARIEKFANPELKWERVAMLNFGLDFRTKDNRVSGSIEYYQKRGLDLFGTAVLDYTGGVGSSQVKNVAGMKGRGLDLELNSQNLKGRLGWSSQLNLSFYKDEITDYYLSSVEGSRFVGRGNNISLSGLVGKPVYGIFSYQWAGLDGKTGDPQGYLNGVKSIDYTALTTSGTALNDLVYHGSALPTVYGSFGNTFSCGAFSLTARLMYKFGYYFRNATLNYQSLYAGNAVDGQFAERWQKPGDELWTQVPSMIYPNNVSRDNFYAGSSINVQKGDHIRLQYITLDYTLGNAMLSRLKMKDLHFFLNVGNVGILWKATKQHVDPDYPIDALPVARTYALGFRSNF